MARVRHFVPSALTAVGMGFAALSIQASVDGLHRSAAWWGMLCVLTDKADGAAARALRASSAFGAQLDSFSDFFSFGVVPSTLFYAFFSTVPSAGWGDGAHHAILGALSLFFLVCVAGRLARFNITHGVPGAERFFFGVPTTFVGGVLLAIFAVLLKYGDPAWSARDTGADRLFLFGHARLDALMRLFPWLLVPGGVLMVSTFRMPKLGRTRWRAVDVVQALGAILGMASALTRRVPEFLIVGAATYFSGSIVFHLRSTSAAADVRLPRLFADVEERDREAAGGGSGSDRAGAAG